MGKTTLYTLEVILTDGPLSDEYVEANPVVSRTIEIPADQTLDQLHGAILAAFGRRATCCRHEFRLGEPPRIWHAEQPVAPATCDDPADPGEPDEEPVPESVTAAHIGRLGLLVGQLLGYWYELGENWYHEIRVVGIGEAAPYLEYPRVVARVGVNPPGAGEEEGDGEEAAEGEPVRREVGAGLTELADGSVIEWRHEVLSPVEASLARAEAAGRTRRVTSLRELPSGLVAASTYLVSGDRLGLLLRAIHSGESTETVLDVEVVPRGEALR